MDIWIIGANFDKVYSVIKTLSVLINRNLFHPHKLVS